MLSVCVFVWIRLSVCWCVYSAAAPLAQSAVFQQPASLHTLLSLVCVYQCLSLSAGVSGTHGCPACTPVFSLAHHEGLTCLARLPVLY